MAERDSWQFWDREVVRPTHVSWMEPLVVRHYINESIGGKPGSWPLDWFQERFARKLPFDRGLSIGCGSGPLERELIRRGICRRVDAFDGSIGSVSVAREKQREEKIGGIHYFVADFNFPALPRAAYDIVFFHQSLHHVTYLERLFRAVMAALRPGGMLYLDEYIGPSRTDWSDELIAPHRRIFSSLPEAVQRGATVQLPIQDDDPSEAIRSGEIMRELAIGFSVREKRDYGGTFLSVLYPYISGGAGEDEAVRKVIDAEKAALRGGELAYYSVIVAQRRSFLRRWIAEAIYRLQGKRRREELAKLVRGDFESSSSS